MRAVRGALTISITLLMALILDVTNGGVQDSTLYLPIARSEPGPPAIPSPTTTPLPAATATPSYAETIINLVNTERTTRGLTPLQQVQELMQAGVVHSQDMATHNFLSHTGSDGSDPGERIRQAGYDWNTYGENIAAGYSSPESVVAAWMASSGHRANILNQAFKDVGFGHAYEGASDYKNYWTLVLAMR